MINETCQNKTIVGLKLVSPGERSALLTSQNKTIVGLKRGWRATAAAVGGRQNKTIVGLKDQNLIQKLLIFLRVRIRLL